MNILVCTPGRLLQHMDETPGFDAGQLQVRHGQLRPRLVHAACSPPTVQGAVHALQQQARRPWAGRACCL